MNKRVQGFTSIELILLIVIVGILSALVITTRAGVQQNERDTERQRDIKELRNGLESYFAQTNQYPTLKDFNSSAWRTANMKSIDGEVFHDPSNKSNASQLLVAKPMKDAYAYIVTSASGTDCGTPKSPCTQYSLTATLEAGGTFVKNNLN
jgi:type II secretory pathway pseudopilin PulG